MEKPETITIEAAQWTQEAEALLCSAVESVASVREQIASEGAALFRVTMGGALIGFYVLRIDKTAEGSEGVLVAAVGAGDIDLTAIVLPRVEKQFKNCIALRIHTARPGMAKKLARNGYRAQEIVMRKDLCSAN